MAGDVRRKILRGGFDTWNLLDMTLWLDLVAEGCLSIVVHAYSYVF